jgi:hypothetical protein
MKVLITGGAGHIGKATTERFVRQGWEVRLIGLEQGLEVPGAEFVHCDIMKYDELREQARGCQVIVHLAAIRSPALGPGHKVFEVNVAGTFNVFEAAAAEGIKRVVQASSINAVGCAYNLTDIAPRYLPIDEDHPMLTSDPYSYSKELIEDVGRYFWRRDGISSVALRFPAVYRTGHLHSENSRQHRQNIHALLDELVALPEAERTARLAAVKTRVLEWRQKRPMEFKDKPPTPWNRNSGEEQLWYVYAFDRFNYWAFVDELDAAQSLEKAATAGFDGAHALFINDRRNAVGYDSKTLARLFFPEIDEANIALSGAGTLVSIDKARKLIGFEPDASGADWE